MTMENFRKGLNRIKTRVVAAIKDIVEPRYNIEFNADYEETYPCTVAYETDTCGSIDTYVVKALRIIKFAYHNTEDVMVTLSDAWGDTIEVRLGALTVENIIDIYEYLNDIL